MVSLPRCGCLYRLEVFRNGVAMCPVLRSFCFTSISLWGVYYVKESSAALYVHSTACPSYAGALSSKRRFYRRWVSSVYCKPARFIHPLHLALRIVNKIFFYTNYLLKPKRRLTSKKNPIILHLKATYHHWQTPPCPSRRALWDCTPPEPKTTRMPHSFPLPTLESSVTCYRVSPHALQV